MAGGAIEVGWIALYEQLAGSDGAMVARGVTQSVIPGLVAARSAVPLGLAIHMGLAVALGIVIAVLMPRLLPRLVGTALEPVAVVAMLVGVWAMNFFVILPAINPAFVTLVPYGVSLASKVLFGVAAAFVFRFSRRHLPTDQREL
ncbi:hypothetical protein VSX64_14230 [Aurantimonas sp. C2-6-R+9]|uniref:hypothetical protein n=1 Tax=unclassified Aurantimonas TaxID=2638230 RepID=UPI002E1712C7|nr:MULTISPECIES: hypothetical protein [unclassified Aurantimonas]MEC5292869.1 hypothetical protein [Aurantimonas sp. C2-3-R2]MEC5382027.1 hypothetical protein [Aurantimonas sp. C2-6-R+9]